VCSIKTHSQVYNTIEITSSCGVTFLVCRVKELIYEVGAAWKQIVDCGKNDDQQGDLQQNTGFKPGILHMPKV
jgi:hypothetical protein